ncbi:hypothetical protein PHAVU_002G020400, partial [Phaseolus vulgaris]
METRGSKKMVAMETTIKNGRRSNRERKMGLIQDVDELKRKLRHEENVHRALERAFTRPLGSLPRLPPYLPPHILELVAEVAVLEEEVVRLEERAVNFRLALYQEAVYISSNWNAENLRDSMDQNSIKIFFPNDYSRKLLSDIVTDYSGKLVNSKQLPIKQESLSSIPEEGSLKDKQSLENKMAKFITTPKKSLIEQELADMCVDHLKLQMERIFVDQERALSSSSSLDVKDSTSACRKEKDQSCDPYGICSESKVRDIGRYNSLCEIKASNVDLNRRGSVVFQIHRLKRYNILYICLLRTSIQRTRNIARCLVLLNQSLLNVITIEHFILRLPYHLMFITILPSIFFFAFLRTTCSKAAKNDDMKVRSMFGLEWSELLVTFALSCGSWSSPAVSVSQIRQYCSLQVDNELEASKKDYLQAAVGNTKTNKLIIPKSLL